MMHIPFFSHLRRIGFFLFEILTRIEPRTFQIFPYPLQKVLGLRASGSYTAVVCRVLVR